MVCASLQQQQIICCKLPHLMALLGLLVSDVMHLPWCTSGKNLGGNLFDAVDDSLLTLFELEDLRFLVLDCLAFHLSYVAFSHSLGKLLECWTLVGGYRKCSLRFLDMVNQTSFTSRFRRIASYHIRGLVPLLGRRYSSLSILGIGV